MDWHLFDTNFLTKFDCLGGDEGLAYKHITADFMIAAACLALPITLIYFIRRRKNRVPFVILFWFFSVLLLFCGLSHLLDAVTGFWPACRLWGDIKVITTALAWATVFVLWRLMPQALRMKTPAELDEMVIARTAELKEANALLAQKVQERDQAIARLKGEDIRKNEFVAMLAHELRNPLAPILTALPVIKNAVPADAAPIVCRFSDAIERQVKSLSRIINDLLDIGRINGGTVPLKHELVNFRSIIEHAVEAIRPVMEKKGHECIVDMPQRKIIIIGDVTRIEQVFTNLLQNAAKYTDFGGRITVAAKVQNGQITTIVTDNGQGITEDILPYVFDLFQQGVRDLDRSQGGLGLGLTIVKKLVELHGGSVMCRSAGSKQGSEFTVNLPTIESKTRVGASPMLILVVDDNLDATDSLQAYLELGGHTVDAAFDGTTAIQKAMTKTYDVILLDIGLPGVNGYEVCRTLRAADRAKHVIAVTGYGQDEDKNKSKAAGFDRHLVKPVDPAILDEVLLAINP